MTLLDTLIEYGLLAVVFVSPLNVVAWLLWPRRSPPDGMAEPHGDVPHVTERSQ